MYCYVNWFKCEPESEHIKKEKKKDLHVHIHVPHAHCIFMVLT